MCSIHRQASWHLTSCVARGELLYVLQCGGSVSWAIVLRILFHFKSTTSFIIAPNLSTDSPQTTQRWFRAANQLMWVEITLWAHDIFIDEYFSQNAEIEIALLWNFSFLMVNFLMFCKIFFKTYKIRFKNKKLKNKKTHKSSLFFKRSIFFKFLSIRLKSWRSLRVSVFLIIVFFRQGVRPACSCVDCVSSCPKPPPPEPTPQPFLIWSLDGYAVVMFFIFLLGSAIFVMGTGCCASSEAGKWTSIFMWEKN